MGRDNALPFVTDDYPSDGSQVTKSMFVDLGEIEFIACADITDSASEIRDVLGVPTKLETPAEIIAKKVYYRGARAQARDMFDIAAVAEAKGRDYLVSALKCCEPDALTIP